MGFRDFRSFNLVMLAKQGCQLSQEPDSLLFKCFKARYFPRGHFLDAQDCPNSSYTWKSMMAAKPILAVCCHVGNGASIRALHDPWIPNQPSWKIIHQPDLLEFNYRVHELIDYSVHGWDQVVIS